MTGGTPVDLGKLRSIGVISRRSGPRVTEGREHPDSGKPYKTVTDELGNQVTEHSAAGRAPGVSGRQDVNIAAPPVHVDLQAGPGAGT